MIKLEDVSYTYKGGTKALKGVSVDFPKGVISAVIGESGSGKTTLMMCIGQFLKPQHGEITIEGTDIYSIPEKQLRHKVGIVFQNLYLFQHRTVMENLAIGLIHVHGIAKPRAEKEALAILDHLTIIGIANKYPAQITTLQAQRVAIARALLLRPDYVLLDEPFSALDDELIDDFGRWLGNLIDETNFIIFSNDPILGRKVANRGIFLSRGEILSCGDPDNIEEKVKAEGIAPSLLRSL